MKTKRLSIFLFSLLLIVCSCKNSTPLNEGRDAANYLPDYDVQSAYSQMGGSVSRYDNVYYMKQDSWLFYYEDESKASGKLCAKPECSHDNESCNAYVGAASGIQVYDSMIYWADITSSLNIWRIDLSGNHREMVMQKPIDISGTKMNAQVVLQRGYVYYSEIEIEIQNGQNQQIFTLSRYDLAQPEEEPEILYQREDPRLTNYICQWDRNQAYILLDSSLETGEYVRTLLSCDLSSGQTKELWNETSSYFTTTLLVREGELHLLSTKLVEDRRYQHTVYSPEKGTWELQDEGEIADTFRSIFLVDGFYVWRIFHEGEAMGYEVETWDHESVYQGETEGLITRIGKDENGVILTTDRYLNEGGAQYLVIRVSEKGEEVLLSYTK